ncbi:Pol protein [Phytophthora palmivora]|uniref:Pol protein n=1 Tax=Phytophthora palmivora TaxID=4796 RepID=A0A2P4WZH7_9STRA|nr:Pol protein [Phytophthora palmivora]
MSTADHPRTDGQTERVNRVLEDTLRSICAEAPRSWSDQLPMVEFALNNAVHASTGFTPFYLRGIRHPYVPLTLRGGTEASIVRWESLFLPGLGDRARVFERQLASFIDERLDMISRIKQKEHSDRKGRGNLIVLKMGEFVLLDTKTLTLKLHKVEASIRPTLRSPCKNSAAHTIDLPKSMATHPMFHMGILNDTITDTRRFPEICRRRAVTSVT